MISYIIQVIVNLGFGVVMSYLAITHFLKDPTSWPVFYFGLFLFAQYVFNSTLTNLSVVYSLMTTKTVKKQDNPPTNNDV